MRKYGFVQSCTPTQDGHFILRVKIGRAVKVVPSLREYRESAEVEVRQDRCGDWVLA